MTDIPADARPIYNAPSARLGDRVRAATGDLLDGWRRRELWTALGFEELKRRYHGTALGLFWSIASYGLFVGIFILVFGVFGSAHLPSYSVHVSVGWLVWTLLSNLFIGGSTVFFRAGPWIAGTAMPYTTFIFRDVWIELLLAGAAASVVVLIIALSGAPWSTMMLLAFPGFALCILFGFAAALALGVICLRLKDLRFVTQVGVRAAFFLTPILWEYDPTVDTLRTRLAIWNPVTHFLEIVREPLAGNLPSAMNYAVAGGTTLATMLVAFALFAGFRRRIPLWA